MGTYNIANVNPGDLIQASYIDRLVAAINDLDRRVTLLAGQSAAAASQLVINSVTPTGLLNILDTVTVTGANFTTPASANTVTIGGYQVGVFEPGSGPGTLIFAIPQFPPSVQLSATGTAMLMTITNAAGSSAVWLLTVAPQVVYPSGSLNLSYSVRPPAATPSDDLIHPAVPYAFGFTMVAHVFEAGNYLVTATMSNSAWTAAIQGGQQVSGGSQLTFAVPAPGSNTSGSMTSLTVTVTPPNVSGGTATLTLNAQEVTPGGTVTPAPPLILPITIGQSIPPLAVAVVSLATQVDSTGAVDISAAAGGTIVTLDVTFFKAATYTTTFVLASSNYTFPAAASGATSYALAPQSVTSANLPASGSGYGPLTQAVRVQAQSGAGPSTLNVQITDDAGDPPVSITVNIAP